MISALIKQIKQKLRRISELRGNIDAIQQSLGRIEARQIYSLEPGDFAAAEFKVSSQFGEDGIIEHLLRHVPIDRPIFIEFGVEDYAEANTRFLLRNRNWSGLVMDGSTDNMAKVRNEAIYWRHNIKAEAAFITKENIDALISGHGIFDDIGLLSIDIDGNDYWVWEAISGISPRIVIVEYNALYGSTAKVAVPYDPQFIRFNAHKSGLYWGCSLAALVHLAGRKNYRLVGCNTAGINAFFVRNDVSGRFANLPTDELFVGSQFRQSRDPAGKLNYLSGDTALREISAMPLIDVETGQMMIVGDIPRLVSK